MTIFEKLFKTKKEAEPTNQVPADEQFETGKQLNEFDDVMNRLDEKTDKDEQNIDRSNVA
jgi:hypothetical protein